MLKFQESQSTGIDNLSITVKGAHRSNTSQSKLVSWYTCIFNLFFFCSFQGGIIAWTARPVCADSGSTVSSPYYKERLRWWRWLFGQEIYRGTPDRSTGDWKQNCKTSGPSTWTTRCLPQPSCVPAVLCTEFAWPPHLQKLENPTIDISDLWIIRANW